MIRRRGFDLAVYRAQLDELERERERGLLGPEEAAAARLEVGLPDGRPNLKRWYDLVSSRPSASA